MILFDSCAPYTDLDGAPKGQADYVEQDGVVFAWSESNIDYESIMKTDGTVLVPFYVFERIERRNGSLKTYRPNKAYDEWLTTQR